jgi:hypothetical protein
MSRFAVILTVSVVLSACVPASQQSAEAIVLAIAETRTWSSDERVSIPISSNLLVHRVTGGVMAMTPNGSFGLGVERLQPERLIRLASAGKDLLSSNGWKIETEQHFEHAIFVRAFRKGRSQNRTLRELWWVERAGGTYRCDGTATGSGIAFLGNDLRQRCQAVGFDKEGSEGALSP